MSTDPADFLGRVQRAIHVPGLRRRDEAALLFAESIRLPERTVYDTTVYIDVLRGKLSPHVKSEVSRLEPWHCAVVESELAYTCGRLDPGHPGTAHVVEEIVSIVQKWPANRVLTPDRAIWREAAILTGVLARAQGMKDADRGRTMNDALIFLTALGHGCTVLSRNVRDFDLLMQLVPAGKAIFYRV
ncbi:MAG: PIN domain-containing protein [Acidobacteriaceae bacterium]